MGYSDFANFKLVDGYTFTATSGQAFSTNWVDIHSVTYFNVSAVFTGGSPAGTLKIQQSNDLQGTGLLNGRVAPLHVTSPGGVDDSKDAATGNGAVTVAVSGAGVYLLDQHFAGFRWFKLVYTPSASGSTQLDVFVTWKK